jgi:hypothetical protein
VVPLPPDEPGPQPVGRTGVEQWSFFECSSFAGTWSLDRKREINRFVALQRLIEVRTLQEL